jgi:hypothetical protein
LFEWKDKVNEQKEGLVEEDLVPYPALAVELKGVILYCDTLAIEDKTVPRDARRMPQHEMPTLHHSMLSQECMAPQLSVPTMTKSNTTMMTMIS